MRTLTLSVLSSLLLLSACQQVDEGVERHETRTPSSKLTLLVSNQSFAIDPVNISITVDGEPVVDQLFEVGTQHTWREFAVNLLPGKHNVQIKSSQAPDRTESIEIDAPRWAVVNFWYYPADASEPYGPLLSFDIYDTQPFFD